MFGLTDGIFGLTDGIFGCSDGMSGLTDGIEIWDNKIDNLGYWILIMRS